MKNQTITFSKTAIIVKCCAITASIAFLVSGVHHINIHQFITNLLDWQSI